MIYLKVHWFFFPLCLLKSTLNPSSEYFISVILLFQNFCLILFYSVFLLIFSIWWDIILIFYFSFLDLVSFSSLTIFDLRSFNRCQYRFWASSGIVSFAILSVHFLYLIIWNGYSSSSHTVCIQAIRKEEGLKTCLHS